MAMFLLIDDWQCTGISIVDVEVLRLVIGFFGSKGHYNNRHALANRQ